MDLLDIIQHELKQDPNLTSDHTRRAYREELQRFEAWRHGRLLTRALVDQYVAEQQVQGKAPASINRALSALRWWALRLLTQDLAIWAGPDQDQELLLAEITLISKLENLKYEPRRPRGRRVTPREVQALIGACKADPSPIGVRDMAMIGLAWTTGVTHSELALLQRDWIVEIPYERDDFQPEVDVFQAEIIDDLIDDHDDDGLFFEDVSLSMWVLLIDGPGSDFLRKHPLTGMVINVIQQWFKVRGDEPGYLFCRIRKGNKPDPAQRLSNTAVLNIIRNRCRQAEIAKPITWNDLRYSMIVDLLEAGTTVETIQKIVGHKWIGSTLRYAQREKLKPRRQPPKPGEINSDIISWGSKSDAAFQDLEDKMGEDPENWTVS